MSRHVQSWISRLQDDGLDVHFKGIGIKRNHTKAFEMFQKVNRVRSMVCRKRSFSLGMII